jgi:hypothetical protein
MTKPRIFQPENRLAKILADGGQAASRSELAQGAEANLRLMAQELAKDVAENVQRLGAISDLGDPQRCERASEAGLLAMSITDLAVNDSLAAIGEVARGITVLVDAYARGGAWRSDVFVLHVDALRLVHNEGGSLQAYKDMLSNLKLVRRSLGVRD